MDEQAVQNAGQQVNAVVDKLAEKLDVAADRIAPVAEQMIREIAAEGWISVWTYSAVGTGALLLVWLLVGVWSMRQGNARTRWTDWRGYLFLLLLGVSYLSS